jgi:hypothetical protein
MPNPNPSRSCDSESHPPPLADFGQLRPSPPSPWGAFEASYNGASKHPRRFDGLASVCSSLTLPWRLGLRLPPLLHAGGALGLPWRCPWACRAVLGATALVLAWPGLAWRHRGLARVAMAAYVVFSPRCALLLSLIRATSSSTSGCLGIYCPGARDLTVHQQWCSSSCACASVDVLVFRHSFKAECTPQRWS